MISKEKLTLIQIMREYIRKQTIPIDMLSEVVVSSFLNEISKFDLCYENGIKHSEFEPSELIEYINVIYVEYVDFLNDILDKIIKPSRDYDNEKNFYKDIIGNLDEALNLARLNNDYKALADITMKKETLSTKLSKIYEVEIKEKLDRENRDKIDEYLAKAQKSFNDLFKGGM